SRDIPVFPGLMVSDEMTEDFGYQSTRSMLNDVNPPTAFLVSSMITAIGVRRAIVDAGMKMGQEVSVVIHDDELSYLRNGAEIPIFTAARSSVRQAGRACAKMLLENIEKKPAQPQHLLLESEITIGESTGPAPVVS
ncbi:MAG: substrate-binding domain-containing protein, partial [Paracoccaceae bacterium]